MEHIWQILIQFVFRVTFGVALAIGVTPPKLVTSGYYRIHLWVLLGLNTFAALVLYSQGTALNAPLADYTVTLGFAIGLAVASYAGSVLWLYEKKSAGQWLLFGLALTGLTTAALATPWNDRMSGLGLLLAMADLGSSGLLLGVTLAAMFLGHWYLNTPSMHLLPLKRLVALMAIAIVIRTLLCATGLALQISYGQPLEFLSWVFVGMRWFSGLLGTLMMAMLSWQTLKVPNTQSATGILYAGVILAFIGELTSQLLSVDALYPL